MFQTTEAKHIEIQLSLNCLERKNVRVVFWSPQRHCGTTSHMLLTAAMIAERMECRTVLIPSLAKDENFKDYFSRGKQSVVRENCAYGEENDELLRAVREGSLTPKHIGRAVKTLKKGRLFCCDGFLPQRRTYDRSEVEDLLSCMIAAIDHMADYVFIDCGCTDDAWTREQLRQADLVIANLAQTQDSLYHLFCRHAEVFAEQLYFISSYQKDSIYNKENISRICSIEKWRLGVFPYNPEFELACINGRLDRYVEKKERYNGTEMRQYFFEEADRSVRLVMERLKLKRAKEEAAKNQKKSEERKGENKYEAYYGALRNSHFNRSCISSTGSDLSSICEEQLYHDAV